MLTTRGWWFLTAVILQVVLGVVALPTRTVAPAAVGLALLAWFGWEWAAFHRRLNSAVRRLRVGRRLFQGDREVPMVWAGVPFTVRVTIDYPVGAEVPYAFIEDRVPPLTPALSGVSEVSTALVPGTPVELSYGLRVPVLGALRFEGVRVRVADLHGFFYHRTFLREGAEYLVLPRLCDDRGRQRADKRFNALPPPGTHRLRRPGSGSELLDLRDYRAGDPPKMIAWKASARRDRLITKEFESDVPVRCVLFLDATQSVRIGPPGATALVHLASLASGVAQAAAGNRDLVGLTTFDEAGTTALAPARTRAHLIGLLRRLSEAAARLPDVGEAQTAELTRRGTAVAREYYPELLSSEANAMPWGRLWRPLLDARWGWLALAAVAATPLLVAQKEWLGETAGLALALRPGMPSGIFRFLVFLALWAFLAFSPLLMAAFAWFLFGVRGWFNPRREALTRRKKLSALLALRNGTGATRIERYLHDEAAYAEAVGRFLTDHGVRCPMPLYDGRGRYRFRSECKAEVLAVAVTRAVARARDNELYVILADLVELGPDLGPVLKAARMARARHHRVLVIVPWPANVPEPTADDTNAPAKRPAPKGRGASATVERDRHAARRAAVHAAVVRDYHRAFAALRRDLGRVGSPVLRVSQSDAVGIVLDRLDRLRGMRARR